MALYYHYGVGNKKKRKRNNSKFNSPLSEKRSAKRAFASRKKGKIQREKKIGTNEKKSRFKKRRIEKRIREIGKIRENRKIREDQKKTMMLKEKIQQDLKNALKEARETELSVLRMVASAIVNKEKDKRYKIVNELRSFPPFANARVVKEKPDLAEEELEKESRLTDEEVLEVISSEVKKRKEAALLFEKGARQDLAEKEKEELKILQRYLPEQISEEELKKLVKEAIDKTGAKEMKDMGKVMAELMPRVKGRADGSLVSKIIRELLS